VSGRLAVAQAGHGQFLQLSVARFQELDEERHGLGHPQARQGGQPGQLHISLDLALEPLDEQPSHPVLVLQPDHRLRRITAYAAVG
jgi:hypothetical protein